MPWWFLFIARKWDGRAIHMKTLHIRLPNSHEPSHVEHIRAEAELAEVYGFGYGSVAPIFAVRAMLRVHLFCRSLSSFSIRIISGNGFWLFTPYKTAQM